MKFLTNDSKIMSQSSNVWREIGACTLAPLLHSFAWWLHRQALRDGRERLIFFARDGYMLQRAYEAVIPPDEQLPTQYMYASRRLFNVAGIRRLDDSAMQFLMGDFARMPVGNYLERIGLRADVYEQQITAAGFAGMTAVVTQDDVGKLQNLLMELGSQILAQAAQERVRLVQYAGGLAQWETEKIGIVDAGWHGSLQISLSCALDLPAENIQGYYLGLHQSTPRSTGVVMRAYMDESRWSDRFNYSFTVRQCVELLEIFLSSPEGSIVGLEADGSKSFRPVRIPTEIPTELADGLAIMQVSSIQALHATPGPISRRVALRRLRRLLLWPARMEADAIGEILHQEGFGGLGRLDPIARPTYRLRDYIFRPGQLLRGVRKAYWRPGFLRRLRI